MIEGGWDPNQVTVVDYWDKNRAAIDLARKASAMPRSRFAPIEPMTIAPVQWQMERSLRLLAQLLALDTRERLSRGDLPGAWDDILAQFRMANQIGSSTPTLARMNLAARSHHRAVGLAFDWLGDARQAPETTRRALADLKALPPLPELTDCLRVEASIVERSLDLPGTDLADLVLAGSGGGKPSTLELLFYARVVAPPWERQRARRVCRLVFAEESPMVAIEPWRRGPFPELNEWNIPQFRDTRLARMILPSFKAALDGLDREVVGRRALEQAVALVAWKLDHGGDYPKALEAIVPGLLDRLPLDPYSGRAFGYIRSEGQMFSPPIDHDNDIAIPPRLRPTKPGQLLLYSVGPDRKDDEGKTVYGALQSYRGDYLFAIP